MPHYSGYDHMNGYTNKRLGSLLAPASSMTSAAGAFKAVAVWSHTARMDPTLPPNANTAVLGAGAATLLLPLGTLQRP
jgi:hypothetical protein